MKIVAPLFECPLCQRKGFTERGLRHHRCRALPRLENGLRAKLPATPIVPIPPIPPNDP